MTRTVQLALAGALVASALMVTSLRVDAAERRQSSRPKCLTSGTTLDASSQVRLFRIGDDGDHRLYACLIQSRRVRALGDFVEARDGPDRATLAGRLVATDNLTCDRVQLVSCSGTVSVFDVRKRRERFARTVPGRVKSLVLTSTGVVAWIRTAPNSTAVSVLLDDGERVLATGNDIDASSLARAGSRLYWLQAGVPRSVTFQEARAFPRP